MPLVGDYLDDWHKRRSPFLPDGKVADGADLHPSTWMHDESVIRCHLKPAFGELRLNQLTTARSKAVARGRLASARCPKDAGGGNRTSIG